MSVTRTEHHRPFPSVWCVQAPGRTIELSEEVSRLREDLEARLDDRSAAESWLSEHPLLHVPSARSSSTQQPSRSLPSMRRVVFERFFDESGGMQLVIHAPFGMRIMWSGAWQ